jgi:AcrR family transcriptional regulator
MIQEERSQRSRAVVLDAALALFSTQGYRATSMREIADKAGVSTGNVYHHFKDKEAIFLELLDVYWRAIEDPDFPVNKALRTGSFPENLEAIGLAARESVARYRPYVTLIYVDVVEFEGSHIRKFYSEMAVRALRRSAPGRDQARGQAAPRGAAGVSRHVRVQDVPEPLRRRARVRGPGSLRQEHGRSGGRDLPHPAARHAQARGLRPATVSSASTSRPRNNSTL